MKLYAFLIYFIPISCIQTSDFDRGYLADNVDTAVTIPFSFDSELIIIEASINGVTGRFLFDNGFSLSALNEGFAERAGIKIDGSSYINDGNNKRTSLKHATIQSLIIGEAEFLDTGSYIIDSNRFLPCDPIDGIIGASVINKINWKIDFEEKELSLSSHAFQSTSPEITLDYSISNNNSSFAEFTFNGVDLRTKIDFGYQGELKVKSDELGYLFKDKSARKNVGIASLSATGLGNIDTTYTLYEEEMTYGEKLLPVPSNITLTENLKYDARMGVGYLKNYEVIINSSERTYLLYALKKEPDIQSSPGYGISIYIVEDSFQIIQKDAHDQFLSSIPLMSKLVSINDRDISLISGICELKKILKSKATAGENLEILLKGMDEPITLPLRKPILKPI